ncbi:MAG: tRNA uridine-5-carboxymethylaminomethyl(34) synthesis GTPase MnmE [Clostridiaceae bacterium]|nr:tRNA uridine-5-carboxymethylaminomethyl(34) synthesis GTPase MnmE [Eubacteriales bacterium]
MDTIFALATPAGGALAVIRISGAEAKETIGKIFSVPVEHARMRHGFVMDGEIKVDEAMAAYFEAPKSYTGEDMAELYTHGGRAVLSRVLTLLSRCARAAEPGEFTRRAFLNGKLDLAQSEAVQDMIAATSKRGAALALEQLQGSLSRAVKAVEHALLDALSGVDAAIDYPEELEEDVFSALPQTLENAAAELRALAQSGLKQRFLREGARVVLLGRPNAGKSSLLNALLGYDRAIVTPIAGTTRDVLEEETLFFDVPVRLTDTAGMRESGDEAERMGVSRAKSAAEQADFLLLAFDGAEALDESDRELLLSTADKPRMAVVCKGDLPARLTAAALQEAYGIPSASVSSLTGEGVEALKKEVANRLAPEAESALVTNARHIDALLRAQAALESALLVKDAELIATDLREALHALGEITGETVDSAVLDRIFSRFCVGK